jgi:hypothetical protein
MVRFLPAAAAAATGILVGSAIVATRFVIDQTGPASLALLRYLIGFCCLLPPVLLSGCVTFERRDLVPMANKNIKMGTHTIFLDINKKKF